MSIRGNYEDYSMIEDDYKATQFVKEWSLDNSDWLNSFLCSWIADPSNRSSNGTVKDFDDEDIAAFIDKNYTIEFKLTDEFYEMNIEDFIKHISNNILS